MAAARAGFHRGAFAWHSGGGGVSRAGRNHRQQIRRHPSLSWENIRHLFQPALTIALLAAIESLLCAVVADGMVDDRHDSNQELMAQGIANIVSPLFGGIAATSA